ncbi:MAG: bifunctional phosphopantothenoylcysteine decarboxylase/phosphopantothenate--cysteine ligase CoaBC [Desulfovibrionaceae bacterium]|nr:bifunctional phosphopantothenoylcysteine decarboxylase/phosphopantothenate--cysteine ligase CoaBC [Desulfovibrionaceae bacterium]
MPGSPHLKFNYFAGRKLHLGVCGSVAAFKTLELLRVWKTLGITVSVTLTAAAREFVTPLSYLSLGASKVYGEMLDGDDVFAHLEPGRLADAMAILPATASAVSRLAAGDASEMLSAQALACDRPKLIAPAMHPRMWLNPATQANCKLLRERGFHVVEPAFGRTACGEEGQGRLADIREIYLATLRMLAPADLAGRTLLITAGPTREFWDGVRFVSNPSFGLMGAALAVAAWLRGAEVKAVCGPGTPWLPAGIERINVESAAEMLAACQNFWPSCSLGCFTAAVCDYRPLEQGAEKLKKEWLGDSPVLRLTNNPDIAAALGRLKTEAQHSIVFAAETSNIRQNAIKKLASKNADMVVANMVGKPGVGFESESNQVTIIRKNGEATELPMSGKADVAWRIWDVFLNP